MTTLHDNDIHHDLQEPRFGPIVASIVVSAVLIFGTSWACYLYFTGSVSEEVLIKEKGPSSMALHSQRANDARQLNELKWRDKSNGAVKIPIDLAMDLVVSDYQKK